MFYLVISLIHVFCMFLPYPEEIKFIGVAWNACFAIWNFYIYTVLKERNKKK